MKKICSIMFIFLMFLMLNIKVNAAEYQKYKEVLCTYYNGPKDKADSLKVEVTFSSTGIGDVPFMVGVNSPSKYSDYGFETDNNNKQPTNAVVCPNSIRVDEIQKVISLTGAGSYIINKEEIVIERDITCGDFKTESRCNSSESVAGLSCGWNGRDGGYCTAKESVICTDIVTEESCKTSTSTIGKACVWNKNESAPNGGYCNVDNLLYVGCGGASDIPAQIPSLISMFVNMLKIATPIILIFISIITLLKAMSAQKEDEIKKATSSLVQKIIAAALVFFVVSIVQFIVSVVAKDDEEYSGFEDCLDCFLNNDCTTNTYYKTVVNNEDWCTKLTTGETVECNEFFSSSE